jgi:hypothetical protein
MGTEETKRQTHKLIYFKGNVRYRKIKQMENKKQKQKVKDIPYTGIKRDRKGNRRKQRDKDTN